MKKIFVLMALVLFVAGPFRAQKSGNHNFEINRNLEVFSDIYKKLDMLYVDTLDADTVIGWAIKSMLRQVDPYTVYYSEDNMEELKTMTTGKYAGIGALVRYIKKEDRVAISEPYENTPAQRAGVRAGDVIQTIDGKDVKGLPVDKVSELLRGEPGSTFELVVKRYGYQEPLVFQITRENIQMPSIPYYNMLDQHIGYIALNSFTENISQEVRRALVDLKERGAQSLILDLRGNGGGSLRDAVNIVNLFVPKGKLVISTKGKLKSANEDYYTQSEPVDPDIPMAVLVDGWSASASEIVSGSLQDLDRAVIIGMRTYGKGFVQGVRELPYHGGLKVTTSRYYIPSGRCIQAYDYRHLNPDGSVGTVPDSLTRVFKTAAGREVRDGGGIKPDIVMKPDSLPTVVRELALNDVLPAYVNEYVFRYKQIVAADSFDISDEDYAAFVQKVKESGFTYNRRSDEVLNLLKETARMEGYYNAAKAEFDALEAKFTQDLETDLMRNKDKIKPFLNDEIVRRYYFQKGGIMLQLRDDPDVKEAKRILTDRNAYEKILQPVK